MSSIPWLKSIKDRLTVMLGAQPKSRATLLVELRADVAKLEPIALELERLQERKKVLTAEVEEAKQRMAGVAGQLGEADATLTVAATVLRNHLASLPGHAHSPEALAGASLMDLIGFEANATNSAIAAVGLRIDTVPRRGTAPATLTARCLDANRSPLRGQCNLVHLVSNSSK